MDLPSPWPSPISANAEAAAVPPATLMLNQRRIVTLRATLLGDAPTDRVELARAALHDALNADALGAVSHTVLLDSVRFELGGQTLFYLVAADLAGPRASSMLAAAAEEVQGRLQTAVNEYREARSARHLAQGVAYSLAATALLLVLLRGLWLARRRGLMRLLAAWGPVADGLGAEPQPLPGRVPGWTHTYAEYLAALARGAASVVVWLLALLLLDAWVTYVLHQFAYTRPWGERATAWFLELLQQWALSVAAAVPGLIVAMLVFLSARLVSRAVQRVLARVERGEIHLKWLDADTAAPTRRLSAAGIWLFALAMAYPYLPGANSEAFKGVSVLAGLMLSLGASSVVGQALSGLSLMYSRSLRVGEYVKVGETEGTVTALGMFTTRIHTGMGEEVSLPNTVVFSQPIRNFSRLVNDGYFMMHASVTIGYATPWRQVHAMLLEAARRTEAVARDPAPYVVQTALSDFYVEYRLCAQSNKNAPSRRVEAMSQLNAHVQDVFNENGVQIMSPHYRSDPSEPQVVPPGPWAGPPAAPLQAPSQERS